MSASFDTLSYARRMESVGFTRAQAEAMAEEQARLIDERLATKADIASLQLKIEEVRSSLARDIEHLRSETKTGMELLRRDVVIRLGSIVIAAVAVGSTVVTLLSRVHP
jgi:hypothetical protein